MKFNLVIFRYYAFIFNFNKHHHLLLKVFSVFKNPWLSFVLNGRKLLESCVNLINVFVGYKVTKYVRRRKILSTNIGFIRVIKLLTKNSVTRQVNFSETEIGRKSIATQIAVKNILF